MSLDLDVLIQKVICSQIYPNLSCYISGDLSKRHHGEMTPTVIYSDLVKSSYCPLDSGTGHWKLELELRSFFYGVLTVTILLQGRKVFNDENA
jgi:hypothetical protein